MEEVKKLQRAEKEKKDALATFGTVDGNKAYKGLNEYANNPFPGLRAIFMGQYVDEYLVVPANSPIKSFADVKGKRIAIGGPGELCFHYGSSHLVLLRDHANGFQVLLLCLQRDSGRDQGRKP